MRGGEPRARVVRQVAFEHREQPRDRAFRILRILGERLDYGRARARGGGARVQQKQRRRHGFSRRRVSLVPRARDEFHDELERAGPRECIPVRLVQTRRPEHLQRTQQLRRSAAKVARRESQHPTQLEQSGALARPNENPALLARLQQGLQPAVVALLPADANAQLLHLAQGVEVGAVNLAVDPGARSAHPPLNLLLLSSLLVHRVSLFQPFFNLRVTRVPSMRQ